MNDFNSCNNVTGIYWLKKPVTKLKIKISLKSQDGIISLPSFEDYVNKTDILLENTPEEYSFKWQQKVFSRYELQHYADVHNCITDTDLKYHNAIKRTDIEPCIVSSYIHEDFQLPLPTINPNNQSHTNLRSRLEHLSSNAAIGEIFGGDAVSTQHLFKSEENVNMDAEEWKAMHVVFDNSEYTEDSQLVFKQEIILLSIYHNIKQNFVIISPDVNDLELNPYSVETAAGVPRGYQYAVDVDFGEEVCGEELVMLLRKLLKKWEKKQKYLMNFTLPPLGRRQYYVTVEIMTATGFEMDNLYIEFDIKVPEGIQCGDNLHGRTHTTEALSVEDIQVWNFGHVVEFTLELDEDSESPPINVFLEVISKDWWCRHRTEGYSYLPLTLDPGRYSMQLSCCRPEELDTVQAESRRFFVGGCNLIKDLDVLAKPQLYNTNFKYVSTGTISLRWSIVSQTRVPGSHSSAPSQPGTSTASALLQGAEAALRKYRKARARLAAATKDMQVPNTSGSGDS